KALACSFSRTYSPGSGATRASISQARRSHLRKRGEKSAADLGPGGCPAGDVVKTTGTRRSRAAGRSCPMAATAASSRAEPPAAAGGGGWGPAGGNVEEAGGGLGAEADAPVEDAALLEEAAPRRHPVPQLAQQPRLAVHGPRPPAGL